MQKKYLMSYMISLYIVCHKTKRSHYGFFFMFARHGRALTGASPEHAQVVGSV